MTEEIYGGCTDSPDDRDYVADYLLGVIDTNDLPESFSLLNTNAKTQGSMNCTAFALTHCFEILNRIEHGADVILNANEQWQNQKETGASDKNGDTLQNALITLFNNGLKDNYEKTDDGKFKITQFAKVNKNLNSLKHRIHSGLPIYTGGNYTKTNFVNARDKGYWTGNDGDVLTGHAFAIVGWRNDNELEVLNSYSRNWGKYKNGTFFIEEKHVNDLYSTYVIFDKKDLTMIFKDVSEESPHAEAIKFLLDNKIMQGYDSQTIYDPKKRLFMPAQSINRAELAQVIFNLIKKYNLK